jgi:hypothetical protein
MASGKGNRASSIDGGEIYPSSGDIGGGAGGSNGFNVSAVEKVRVRAS